MLQASSIWAVFILATNIAWADQAAPTNTETASQQYARSHLLKMANFLGGTAKFSVAINASYEAMQANGQKIEFGEVRNLAVQRPDRLRILETGSDGSHNLMLFDSKNITMLNGATALFAQVPQPGDIDDTVVHFVRDLKMRLPLAPMVMRTFAQELQRRAKSVDYVERTFLMGQPVHHIAVRAANADFQVWIADHIRPLPLRIVLNYPNAEGQPQFRADFTKWDLAPSFSKATFTFKPPTDARQIVFAAQVPPVMGAAQTGSIGNEGGKP
jgi:hypothetical protein